MSHATLVISIIAAVYALWLIYRKLVPSKAHDLPDHLDTEGESRLGDLAPEKNVVLETLAAHLNAPITRGNSIELLVNGDRIFPPMLDAIRDAADSINLLTFVYWQGEIARQFAEELSSAARRGVQVRVLLDAFGSARMKDELVDRMDEAGCHIAYFHPLRVARLPHYNHRTHRKVLVVDGTVGFAGGVGIAEEWTGDAESSDHWRDNHFRITGPAVRYVQGAFAENWREATGEVLAHADFFPPLAPAGSAEIVPITSDPGGTVSTVAFSYWLMLRAARDRVWITTPYFLPSSDIEDALTSAAGRGTDVALLLPGSHNDHKAIQYGARTYYRRLVEAGIRLYEFVPTMIHTKSIVVDRDLAMIGSSNFDNRSFDLNYEIALCVSDPALNRALAEQFEADLEHARRITIEHLDAEHGLAGTIRDHAMLPLRPLL